MATCMAMPQEGTTWELCKLDSDKNVPHKGAGSAVFEASMKWALEHGMNTSEAILPLSTEKRYPNNIAIGCSLFLSDPMTVGRNK